MIEELQGVGFSSQEARVYVGLLKSPSSTGYELAKSTGLQRANVYQVLAGLLKREAVEQTGGDPARYAARPPAEVLGRIKRETARRCDGLIADLSSLQSERPVTALWSLRGREAVLDRAAALVSDATERVAVSLWAEDLEWLGTSLVAAATSGLGVVVNVFGDTDLDVGMVFHHEAPAETVGGHLLTVCADSATALVASLDEPAGGMYTTHPSLVRVVEKLLRDEAYLAAIFERMGNALEREFGAHLVKLRSRLLPSSDATELLSVVGFGAEDASLDSSTASRP